VKNGTTTARRYASGPAWHNSTAQVWYRWYGTPALVFSAIAAGNTLLT
jgi:hypothetical protein